MRIYDAKQLGFRGAIAALVLPFTTAASCDGGTRNIWGECPEDETCSAATPDGLHFRGAMLGAEFLDVGNVKTTAVGGTQDVRVEMVDEHGERIPFLAPHDVKLDTANLALDAAADDTFTIRGVHPGNALVRIVDPATGELFDRLQIATLPIESIATKMSLNVWADITFNHGAPSLLYAPGSTGHIRFAAANDMSLVDTSSSIIGDGVTQTGWDQFKVGELPVGVHTLAVTAGGGAPVTLPFEVAIPDHISGGGGVLVKGEPSLVCFAARRGAVPVHAAFEDYASAESTIERTRDDGCVFVTANVIGPVTVHVRASGLTGIFTLNSVEPSSSPRVTLPGGLPPLGDTAGERAASRADVHDRLAL